MPNSTLEILTSAKPQPQNAKGIQPLLIAFRPECCRRCSLDCGPVVTFASSLLYWIAPSWQPFAK